MVLHKRGQHSAGRRVSQDLKHVSLTATLLKLAVHVLHAMRVYAPQALPFAPNKKGAPNPQQACHMRKSLSLQLATVMARILN